MGDFLLCFITRGTHRLLHELFFLGVCLVIRVHYLPITEDRFDHKELPFEPNFHLEPLQSYHITQLSHLRQIILILGIEINHSVLVKFEVL